MEGKLSTLIDPSTIGALKEKFSHDADGLDKPAFTHALLSTTKGLLGSRVEAAAGPEDDLELIVGITQLFEVIDTDGSGRVDWDEFTSYCVELGMMANAVKDKPLEFGFKEQPGFVDTTTDDPVAFLRYSEDLQQVMVIETNSNLIKLYSPEGRLVSILHTRIPPSGGSADGTAQPTTNSGDGAGPDTAASGPAGDEPLGDSKAAPPLAHQKVVDQMRTEAESRIERAKQAHQTRLRWAMSVLASATAKGADRIAAARIVTSSRNRYDASSVRKKKEEILVSKGRGKRRLSGAATSTTGRASNTPITATATASTPTPSSSVGASVIPPTLPSDDILAVSAAAGRMPCTEKAFRRAADAAKEQARKGRWVRSKLKQADESHRWGTALPPKLEAKPGVDVTRLIDKAYRAAQRSPRNVGCTTTDPLGDGSDGVTAVCVEVCKPQKRVPAGLNPREAQAFRDRHPASVKLVVSCTDGSLRMWTPRRAFAFDGVVRTMDQATVLTWVDHVNMLFTSGPTAAPGTVYCWDLVDRQILFRLTNHSGVVTCVTPVPRYNYIVSGSIDTTLTVWAWAPEQGRMHVQHTLRGHTTGVKHAVYSAEADVLVTGGYDLQAIVWNMATLTQSCSIQGHRASLSAIQITPTKPQAIITLDTSGMFRLSHIQVSDGAQSCYTSQVFEAANSTLNLQHVVTTKPYLSLVAAGRRMSMFQPQRWSSVDDPPTACVYNPVSLSFFLTTGRHVVEHDGATSDVLTGHYNLRPAVITTVLVDPRGRKLILGDTAGTVSVYNAHTGGFMKASSGSDSHGSDVSAVLYCSSSPCIVSSGWDRTVRVFDEGTNEGLPLLRVLSHAHDHDIQCLTLNRHLSIIATGCAGGVVRTWNFETLGHLADHLGHTGEVRDVATAADTSLPLLISADSNGTVCGWAVRPFPGGSQLFFQFENTALLPASRSPLHVLDRAAIVDAYQRARSLPTTVLELRKVALVSPSSASPHSVGSDEVGETLHLITGDNSGLMRVWDLSELVNKMGIQRVPAHALPPAAPMFNPRWKGSVDFKKAGRRSGGGGGGGGGGAGLGTAAGAAGGRRRRRMSTGTGSSRRVSRKPGQPTKMPRASSVSKLRRDLPSSVLLPSSRSSSTLRGALRPSQRRPTADGGKVAGDAVSTALVLESFMSVVDRLVGVTYPLEEWFDDLHLVRPYRCERPPVEIRAQVFPAPHPGHVLILPAAYVASRMMKGFLPVLEWQAHSDAILSLHLVTTAQRPAVVTCSDDRSCCVWGLDGSMMGELTKAQSDPTVCGDVETMVLQSSAADEAVRVWSFRPDLHALEQSRLAAAKEMLAAGGPGIKTAIDKATGPVLASPQPRARPAAASLRRHNAPINKLARQLTGKSKRELLLEDQDEEVKEGKGDGDGDGGVYEDESDDVDGTADPAVFKRDMVTRAWQVAALRNQDKPLTLDTVLANQATLNHGRLDGVDGGDHGGGGGGGGVELLTRRASGRVAGRHGQLLDGGGPSQPPRLMGPTGAGSATTVLKDGPDLKARMEARYTHLVSEESKKTRFSFAKMLAEKPVDTTPSSFLVDRLKLNPNRSRRPQSAPLRRPRPTSASTRGTATTTARKTTARRRSVAPIGGHHHHAHDQSSHPGFLSPSKDIAGDASLGARTDLSEVDFGDSVDLEPPPVVMTVQQMKDRLKSRRKQHTGSFVRRLRAVTANTALLGGQFDPDADAVARPEVSSPVSAAPPPPMSSPPSRRLTGWFFQPDLRARIVSTMHKYQQVVNSHSRSHVSSRRSSVGAEDTARPNVWTTPSRHTGGAAKGSSGAVESFEHYSPEAHHLSPTKQAQLLTDVLDMSTQVDEKARLVQIQKLLNNPQFVAASLSELGASAAKGGTSGKRKGAGSCRQSITTIMRHHMATATREEKYQLRGVIDILVQEEQRMARNRQLSHEETEN